MQGRRPPWILVETELYRYPPSRHPGRFRKFWCLCVFFWYGLTTSMTFSQALGFPIHLNLATNKIPMFFLIAWLRKDRKKLELDTHTHTNPMDGRSLATTGIYKPCQQTHGWDMSYMHPNKIPQERFFHVFARCAWLNSLLWWIDVGHSIQCTIPRLSTQMIKGPYKKTYPIP